MDQVVTTVVVVPDLTGAMGGRGAHLHPTIACLDLAERRKAVSRALRVQGPVDLRAVRAYLTGITPAHQAASSDAATEKKRSTSS